MCWSIAKAGWTILNLSIDKWIKAQIVHGSARFATTGRTLGAVSQAQGALNRICATPISCADAVNWRLGPTWGTSRQQY